MASALGVEFCNPEEAEGGADLVLHASGSETGLQSALTLAGMEATVVEVSWFGSSSISLPLGQAFHSQRLRLVSSQVGTLPASQRSRWSYERRLACAMDLLQDPCLDILISGESQFADLPTTLAELAGSAGALCHRIRYPGVAPSEAP